MLTALLNEIYKENQVLNVPLQPTSSKGLFLGGLQEEELAGYEAYFKRYPDQQKEAVGAPIKKEVIDFIVDSLIVVAPGEDSSFKKRLKKGFYQINRYSPTGRALLRQVRFEQQVDLEIDLLNAVASVYKLFDVIFFDKKKVKDSQPLDLATTFLHEMGHVNEDIQLRPLFDPVHGYTTKEGEGITERAYLFASKEKFILERMFEAEKQAQTYQILSDCLSVFDFFSASINSLCKAYFDLISSITFFIFGQKEQQQSGATIQMRLVSYKRRFLFNQIKAYLKEPSALFSKDKRHRINKKTALKSMSDHMRFLIDPMKKKKSKLFLISCGLFATFLGSASLISSPTFLFLGLLTASVCAGFHCADKYYENNRKDWCSGYNENAYLNSRSAKGYEKGSVKKYRLILKAMAHKYHNYLKVKDLEKSRTDKGEIETLFENQVEFSHLTSQLQKDIQLISTLLTVYGDEKTKSIVPEWWAHENLIKAKELCKNNKRLSLENGIKELLLMRLRGSIFDQMLKQAPNEELLKFETPSLKEAFLKRKKELCPTEKMPVMKRQVVVVSKRLKAKKRVKGRFR
ncbi:MAG: hypothetical protein J6V53_05370 [Alphaproteobacteria bacterium]|nr:hypothetical protein [Alphaproteobacteria bacterium]